MRMLLRALSRHEASVASDKTLIRDIEEYENGEELIQSRETVNDYTQVLESLYLINDQEAFSIHYRSSARIGKSAKRHLADPSLCCACLHLTIDKLLNDHETFGLLFESLVERDLRIYADYLEGQLYHRKYTCKCGPDLPDRQYERRAGCGYAAGLFRNSVP